jgi:excisionase family DNA binding protein
MSPSTALSGPSGTVPESAKGSDLLGPGGASDVHCVPPHPSSVSPFGAYLVPASGPGHLISVQVLARAWGVCTATVYGLAKSGALPSLRVRSSIRFRPEDVDAYLARRQGASSLRPLKVKPDSALEPDRGADPELAPGEGTP